MEGKRVPFDQKNVSEKKTHRAEKKTFKSYFSRSLGKLNFIGSKRNTEVTLKTRETCFFTENLKKPKIVNKKLQKFFFTSVSRMN